MIKLFIRKQFESYSEFVLWQRKHLDGAYVVMKKNTNQDDVNNCQVEMTIIGWIRYNDRVA